MNICIWKKRTGAVEASVAGRKTCGINTLRNTLCISLGLPSSNFFILSSLIEVLQGNHFPKYRTESKPYRNNLFAWTKFTKFPMKTFENFAKVYLNARNSVVPLTCQHWLFLDHSGCLNLRRLIRMQRATIQISLSLRQPSFSTTMLALLKNQKERDDKQLQLLFLWFAWPFHSWLNIKRKLHTVSGKRIQLMKDTAWSTGTPAFPH